MVYSLHCKERLSIFPSSQSVVKSQTLPGLEKFNNSRPGRVWLMTSRPGDRKNDSLFYSVSLLFYLVASAIFSSLNFSASAGLLMELSSSFSLLMISCSWMLISWVLSITCKKYFCFLKKKGKMAHFWHREYIYKGCGGMGWDTQPDVGGGGGGGKEEQIRCEHLL